MKERIFTPKTIEKTFDFAVIGGGLAGTMAAIAAAREGLDVILIERFGCLGGMATSGLIFPFMRDTEKGSELPVNAGLYSEMKRRTHELGGMKTPEGKMYREEYMKIALDRMVAETGRIRVLYNAKLFDAERENDRIVSVTVATVSGNIKIRASLFADATGNADLVAFSGLPYEQGRESDGLCQPVTLCFRFGNVDKDRFDKKIANQVYLDLKAQGKIRNPREDVLVFNYQVPGILHMNTTRVFGIDPCDVEQMSAAETELREQEYEMYLMMRKYVPGMENCELIGSSVLAGIRESRRIVGLSRIEKDDIVGVRKFGDSIARGAYKIDIHNPGGSGTEILEIRPNDYYTIPYSALIPRDASNLIAPGRAVSSAHEALSAIRVMPITTCMGEAAGTAAGLALRGGCAFRDVNTDELREKLVCYGALV